MLGRLHDFYGISVSCDASLESFYERFGMNVGLSMNVRDVSQQQGIVGN